MKMVVAQENAVYPSPTDIAGSEYHESPRSHVLIADCHSVRTLNAYNYVGTHLSAGPRPPAITQAAEVGSWQPPSDSSGLPPPSLTGMGRQAQILGPDNFCLFMPPDPVNENL